MPCPKSSRAAPWAIALFYCRGRGGERSSATVLGANPNWCDADRSTSAGSGRAETRDHLSHDFHSRRRMGFRLLPQTPEGGRKCARLYPMRWIKMVAIRKGLRGEVRRAMRSYRPIRPFQRSRSAARPTSSRSRYPLVAPKWTARLIVERCQFRWQKEVWKLISKSVRDSMTWLPSGSIFDVSGRAISTS